MLKNVWIQSGFLGVGKYVDNLKETLLNMLIQYAVACTNGTGVTGKPEACWG